MNAKESCDDFQLSYILFQNGRHFVFICLIGNWPFWPRLRLNILLTLLLKARLKGLICKEMAVILK